MQLLLQSFDVSYSDEMILNNEMLYVCIFVANT